MKNKKTTTSGDKQTPLMRQYFDLKSKHPDAILLFRVGDFYETFSKDAIKAADILGIVLTARNNGGSKIELAGFPYHSLDTYLPKLVRAGYRVAICEQLEKPSKEKKIVKRGITEVVTPGITFSSQLLEHDKNNYLCAIHKAGSNMAGMALIDVSTGEFLVTEGPLNHCQRILKTYHPAEIIFSREYKDWMATWLDNESFRFHLEPWVFTETYSTEKLKGHFNVESFKGFGVDQLQSGCIAAGAILEYLESTQNHGLRHINNLSRIHTEDSIWLDDFTIKNLELVRVQNRQGKSLKDVLDLTVTPMGSRLLEKWVLMPLIREQPIESRLHKVSILKEQDIIREDLIIHLKKLGDLERIAARIPQRRINPREVNQLKFALQQVAPIQKVLQQTNDESLTNFSHGLRTSDALIQRIGKCIRENPATLIAKGGVIAEGFSAELDDLMHTVNNSQDLLLDIQKIEAENTGIQNLKIGFNNVFGYFLEVTNKYKNKGLVPDHWVRKQTLTGSERYITDELKKLEQKILTAKDAIQILEESIYQELVEELVDYIEDIQHNARLCASLDCLISFAVVAIKNDYVRPTIDESKDLDIKDGRHPVIEQSLPFSEKYVANDLVLNEEDQQIMMITGPNMSGKSALLRQSALICLMAQMGSFVPASSARIGLVDKIFTRVGASDNISSGESTFMVEMNETSSIMNNLSDRSLILLDEIGRGTSTFDGISIAWALAEYLHEHPEYKPKTLFATHYHELNALASQYDRIKNYSISTKQIGKKVIFLRKLIEGGSEHSFGIHVAQMAGMPKYIVNRAQEILKDLESNSPGLRNPDGNGLPSYQESQMQLNIFDAGDNEALESLKSELDGLDLNGMTPIECMMKLSDLQKQMRELDQ